VSIKSVAEHEIRYFKNKLEGMIVSIRNTLIRVEHNINDDDRLNTINPLGELQGLGSSFDTTCTSIATWVQILEELS